MQDKTQVSAAVDPRLTTERDTHFFLAGWNGCVLALDARAHLKNAAKSAPVQPAPAASTAPERWCPDVCPITGRKFFMWVEHWKTRQHVPTYGDPFDSYTIPVRDEGGTYHCERFDHDAGAWRDWEDVGLVLVDDQSFVVAPSNSRYDEIREFAQAVPGGRDTPPRAAVGAP